MKGLRLQLELNFVAEIKVIEKVFCLSLRPQTFFGALL